MAKREKSTEEMKSELFGASRGVSIHIRVSPKLKRALNKISTAKGDRVAGYIHKLLVEHVIEIERAQRQSATVDSIDP